MEQYDSRAELEKSIESIAQLNKKEQIIRNFQTCYE